MAQYGVPIKNFVDAQYFAAGLIPGLLFWFTIVVVFSAWKFNPRIIDQNNKYKPKWILANFLAVILILILYFMPPQKWVEWYPIGWPFVIILGELSLGIIIVFLGEWLKFIKGSVIQKKTCLTGCPKTSNCKNII